MTKESTALEIILNYWVIFDEEKDDCKQIKDILPKSSQIVKTALKELTEYKKVFEKLNLDISDAVDLENWIKLAQFHYENNNKRLKTLKIIKEKEVDVHSWHYNDCNKIPYEIYKQSIMTKTISSELLTQEEYDLLKEVLK